jgi:hypothetical protein
MVVVISLEGECFLVERGLHEPRVSTRKSFTFMFMEQIVWAIVFLLILAGVHIARKQELVFERRSAREDTIDPIVACLGRNLF